MGESNLREFNEWIDEMEVDEVPVSEENVNKINLPEKKCMRR